MNRRLLFVASLHHPETLQREQAEARKSGTTPPIFPTSTAFHFWEKAFRKQDYTVDVFWRNLSGFGTQDISKVKAEKFSNRITPRKVAQAVMHRLPYALNPELQKRNANLLEYARQFQPSHIWLVGDNRAIHADTLAKIKTETGCKIIYVCGTSPIVFSHPIERQSARLYDLVIANDYYHGIQWMEMGAKQMICLPASAIDPDFHQKISLSEEDRATYASDISFVGTLLPEHLYSERIEILESLEDFDLAIWTIHDLPETLKTSYQGSALGDTMLKAVAASKISLNTHGDFMRYGGNMRLFEAAGVGTFQIVDNRPGVHEWFVDGEHLVTFDDAQDLQQKLRYYLAHPAERQKIAQNAYEHVRAFHTYDKRLEQILPIIEAP